VDGKVNGKFAFDLAYGFIATAKLAIVSEADILGGAIQMIAAFDIDLSRVPGNPLNIQMPKQKEPSPPVKGEVVLSIPNGMLTTTDLLDIDPKNKGNRVKLFKVKMQKDKKYIIQLNSTDFDAFLRLLDPTGKVVAFDDDSGGGLNARIEYTPAVSGVFGVVATSFDRKFGNFQLTVTQVNSP
jgi:hypothetical protein